MTDRELLHEYLEYTSDTAFTDLVRRHIDLVYGACLRDCGYPKLAEAATQDVFSLLAHKAGSIHDQGSVVDWLFERSRVMTRNVLVRVMRDVRVSEPGEGLWSKVEPALNDAVASLSETDRETLLLRCFQDRSMPDVGEEIGATDDVVMTRVSHALSSMRVFLEKRGIEVENTVLAKTIAENATPPSSLNVETISETALGARNARSSLSPTKVATSPGSGQQYNPGPLIAALATIAIVVVVGIIVVSLPPRTLKLKGKQAAQVTLPAPAADTSTQTTSTTDPFTSTPPAASTPTVQPASTASTTPAKPEAPDVPTDANGLVIGPTQPAAPSTTPPPAAGTPVTPAAGTPVTPAAPSERLTGIVTGVSPTAVMVVDGQVRNVSVGSTVDDGHVTDIAADHVTITGNDGKSRTLTLSR